MKLISHGDYIGMYNTGTYCYTVKCSCGHIEFCVNDCSPYSCSKCKNDIPQEWLDKEVLKSEKKNNYFGKEISATQTADDLLWSKYHGSSRENTDTKLDKIIKLLEKIEKKI